MTNVLAGNPAALGARAESYLRSAAAILEAAEDLSGLVIDQESESTDSVGRASKKLAKNLRVAHRRYVGTARALKTYSVDLSRIQQNYREAQEEAGAGASAGGQAEYEIDRLTRTYQAWESQNVPASLLNDLSDQVRYWQGRERSAGAVRDHAQGVMRGAENDLEEAARRAIDAIENAIDQGADSRWARVKKFAGDVYGTFVDIGKWAAKSIATKVAAIAKAVGRALKASGRYVAVNLLMAALGPMGVAARSLALVVGALPPELRLRFAFSVLAVVSPLAAMALTSRVLGDVLAPDPKVYLLGKTGAPKTHLKGLRRLNDGEPRTTIVDLLRDAGAADSSGESDSTVIDIRRVVDADGSNARWVVTLPSTQDWQSRGDRPAANDMDTNAALKLFPQAATQYERAVFTAMERAGVVSGRNGDPVMVVGFSQGGIMAGHLAANRSDRYNFTAVLAAGAPIDDMNIPSRTKVVSLQHKFDPVHRSDIVSGRQESEHWTTLGGGGQYVNPKDSHNVAHYATTLERNEHKIDGSVRNGISPFLVGHTERRQQFVFKEDT